MQHEDFSLDKNESIANNIDATGKKWHIVPVRGLGLYQITAMDDRVTIPKEIKGKWTKREWIQERLTQYLEKSWGKAETAQVKQARTEQAAKEAAKKQVESPKEQVVKPAKKPAIKKD